MKNVSFYPVNLQINNRSCLVVGGGSVAERKVQSLLAAGASVAVLSPEITEALADMARERRITYISRCYQHGDIGGFFIVICATNNKEVNQWIADEANQAGALVNVIDAPENGNFVVPSQIARGDLLLTVSTNGKSPALAKKIGAQLAQQYGPEYGLYLDLLAKARLKIKEVISSSKERELFWRQMIDDQVINLLKEGKIQEAEAKINNAIGCFRSKS